MHLKLVVTDSQSSTLYFMDRVMSDVLKVRIMCLSGVTWLPAGWYIHKIWLSMLENFKLGYAQLTQHSSLRPHLISDIGR